MTTLDARTEAWVQRHVHEAPPLTQRQQDTIASVFAGEVVPGGVSRKAVVQAKLSELGGPA